MHLAKQIHPSLVGEVHGFRVLHFSDEDHEWGRDSVVNKGGGNLLCAREAGLCRNDLHANVYQDIGKNKNTLPAWLLDPKP